MKTIFLCTTNKGKLNSFIMNTKKYNINIINIDFDIPESREEDCSKISEEKVIYSYNKIKKPVITIDSGLYIKSLGGFPKTFVNFSLKTIGIEGIIKLLKGKQRDCKIINSISFLDDTLNIPITFKEIINGKISETISGDLKNYNWSILHKIFIPNGYNETLANMKESEYEKWNIERVKKGCIEKLFKFILTKNK